MHSKESGSIVAKSLKPYHLSSGYEIDCILVSLSRLQSNVIGGKWVLHGMLLFVRGRIIQFQQCCDNSVQMSVLSGGKMVEQLTKLAYKNLQLCLITLNGVILRK